MKAIVFDKFGGPEVLYIAELPMPIAGPGQVVVKVAASTVNPTDLMMRNGKQAALMTDLFPPWIAGMEFTGYISEVGEGVQVQVGARVLGVVNPRTPAGGAYAEYIVVPAASVAELPGQLDLVAAATLPMNALTAMLALEMTGVRPGQSLLVTGGTGILGGLVLQIAHERGIETVSACRDEDRDLLTALRTDVILPRDGDLAAEVRDRFPDGVDALIDGALIGGLVSGAVRDGGAAVSLRKSHLIEDGRLKVGYVAVTNGMEDNAILVKIASLVGDRKLTPRVAEGGVFTCEDAVAAHRMAEAGGFRGRVVLTFAT
jgi:NADPH:quinone reductase-like Zn-dependent oxidoreductase